MYKLILHLYDSRLELFKALEHKRRSLPELKRGVNPSILRSCKRCDVAGRIYVEMSIEKFDVDSGKWQYHDSDECRMFVNTANNTVERVE